MNELTNSRLEEIQFNAWPAFQTLIYEGWIVRLTNGYTKRANSVNILDDSRMSIDLRYKITRC